MHISHVWYFDSSHHQSTLSLAKISPSNLIALICGMPWTISLMMHHGEDDDSVFPDNHPNQWLRQPSQYGMFADNSRCSAMKPLKVKKLKRKPARPARSSPKECSRPQWPNLLSMWPWRRWSTKPCMHIQDQASFQFTLSPASWGRWSTEKLKEMINWDPLNKRILFSLINWDH